MRSMSPRPNARLVSIRAAAEEFGLPSAMLREMALRGELEAVRPPRIRRIFLVRSALERAITLWRVSQ